MEVKKVTIQDGNYVCDIDISVEEWEEILQDETLMTKNYKDTLIKFYNEPNHKSTCKALGEKYNLSPQSLNGTITAFAKVVQKKLNRFEVIGTDNEPTYWIISMTGKYVGEHFEWTIRPELVKALEEIIMNTGNILQQIYDNAIKEEHWVFFDWFPSYEQCVKEYKEQAINGIWEERIFQRLVKDTTENGISDLQQGNFTWEEFENIKTNWSEIQSIIKDIAEKNNITPQLYQDIFSFFRKYTKGNRPAGTNRVIAAFLPNVVTTAVTHGYFNYIIRKLQKILSDYPYISGDWLQDNLNLINYFNSKVDFKHPWHSSLFAWYLREYFENEENHESKKIKIMKDYTELLNSNKNLILTGAPGTGKTYLAKQIALSLLFKKQEEDELTEDEKQVFKDHFCFVQFHPSYDYTDFVEGLRAEDLEGQVIFNLHNGTFKAFCKKALVSQGNKDISVLYDDLADQIENGDIKTIKLKNGSQSQELSITTRNRNKNIHWFDQTNKEDSRNAVTKQRLLKLYEKIDSLDKLNAMANINEEIRAIIKGCNTSMYWAVLNYLLNQSIEFDNKPYIFVIDEINRGEISKIFGELFFSIDPGYRGTNGKVKTQYANIQSDETIYDYHLGSGWFYVPDNVFIIGTMNDIDRSVESMDFAMRRRFAWKEIKSIDRISMWNGKIDDWKEEAEQRMLSLNTAIEKTRGLSSAYHIGPAYFLKLEKEIYNGDFRKLWDNHLHGVLFEYLRSLPNAEGELEKLKQAYNLQQ